MMIDLNSLLGFMVSGLLLINISKENRYNLFLCLFFISISLLSIARGSTLYSENFWAIYYLMPNGTFIFSSSAVFMYLYFKYIFQEVPYEGFLKREYVHFIVPGLLLVNIIPHMFLPADERIRITKLIIQDPYNVLNVKTLFLPFTYNFLIRAFMGVIYCILSFNILRKNYFAFKDPQRALELPSKSWFQIIVFASIINYLSTFWLSMASRLFTDNPFKIYNIKQLMMLPTISLMVIVCSVFLFPKVIYGLMYRKKSMKRDLFNQEIPMEADFEKLPKKYTDFNFAPENNHKLITDKLKIYFSSKPFLKPGFTLSVIAKETNIPYHQLTNYFNNYLGINFNDWKNNARIEYALDLLDSGRTKNLTLESIGYSCGFLSRSNFVNSFRKKVGMTPSEYVKTQPKFREKDLKLSLEF